MGKTFYQLSSYLKIFAQKAKLTGRMFHQTSAKSDD